MHLDTGCCNVSSAATKWHGTTQNMSFRPKIVDWACLLQSTRNGFGVINSCIKCTLLALLKYTFYYTIRRGFGNFFGMIHVLTHHLAPELDHFLFCPGFWSMLCFGRKLDIFGDVLTHGHNWAKMRNKEKRPHTKDGTERGQKGPKPADLGPSEPAGPAHSGPNRPQFSSARSMRQP